ncbi:protein phosphatase 2C domain-containing protein (plasmid) [Actinoplanes sp. CA-051413]|uniref:protein phosphatase 2C domain-containing protein n=1 Tax=Actinoplanes sp. CA-051413 TaxID=3239899 RepID=UPI003D96E555
MVTDLVQTSYASESAPAGDNEDRFRAGENWALVLDGAGRYPGRTGGCVHPVTWIVEHLADHLAYKLTVHDRETLPYILAAAIRATMADHGPTCDLSDPLSPGAAVAILRTRGDLVEWLVLADCAVVVEDAAGKHTVVIDDRVDHLPDAPVVDAEVRTYDPDYVATVRNRPGGFWVASTVPEAAGEALMGQAPLTEIRQALLCSDGVTRLVERHGWTWQAMFAVANDEGPQALIDEVRRADGDHPRVRHWRGKIHDDATAALCRFTGPEG